MPETDPYNIAFEEVEQFADKWGRIALRVPGHCVIAMDDLLIGPGMYRQFEDTPHGYVQAKRWMVRLVEEDIESEQKLEEIEAEHEEEIKYPQ